MEVRKLYQLRKGIIVQLGTDGFVRVLKKHSLKQGCTLEALYAISKIQGVILLLFEQPNEIVFASAFIENVFGLESQKAKEIVKKVIEKFSGILDTYDGDEHTGSCVDFDRIKKLLLSNVHNPKELKPLFTRTSIPKSVIIFITDTCACNCVYCKVDAGTGNGCFISKEVIVKIAMECEMLGIRDIELTGGDPMMHPEFNEILRIFKKYNIPVSFSTKCPIDKDRLLEVKEAGVDVLQISLDSMKEEVVRRLTRTLPDYFEKLISTIINAVMLNMQIKVKSVITKLNIDDCVDMIEKLYHIGVRNFVLQQLSCGDRSFSVSLMPSKDQYYALEENLDCLDRKYEDIHINRAYSIEYLFSPQSQKKYFRQDCMAGKRGIVIQVDGAYAYCGQTFNPALRFSNVFDMGILEAWNSDEMAKLVNPDREMFMDTQCYECEEFDVCLRKRCYIRTYNKWGRIFDVDPMCPHFKD